MEKNSHQELTVLEREKLLKSGASDILFCVSQLKLVEAHNENRSRELELKAKELQSLSSDIDKKVKDFEKEKSEAGNLKKMVEECTQELRSKQNELGHFTAQLQKLCSEAGKVQDETDKKKKELSLILDKIKESENNFMTVDEQLKSARRLFEVRSVELQSLNNQVTVCGEEIDSKSKHLGKIQKLIEQQTIELGAMQNQCDSLKLFIQEELVAKEKIQKEILEAISRSFEMAKEIKAAETEVSDLNVKFERFRHEVEGKEKELHLLRNEIESEVMKFIQVKREREEETDRKKKDLVLILSKIEESGKKLAALDEQVECAGESSKRFENDIALKEKKLQSLTNLITVCGKEIDSKSKESGEIQKLIEQKLTELNDMKIKCDFIELSIQERSQDLVTTEMRHKEVLEERAKEVEAAATEARDLNVKSKRIRQEVKGKEKELTLLTKQIDSEEQKRIQSKREMEEMTDRKKKELSLILDQTKESSQKLAALDEQVDSLRRLVERLSVELECVVESSKRFLFDLEVKEKRYQALNSLITISSEQLDLKSKELVAMERDVELQKQLREMIAALVNREKQPAAEAAPTAETEEALMHCGIAALTRHEVSSILRAMTNPADYVLELVHDDICERRGLHDSFLEVLVLLFEELAKIQRPDESQLQLKAEEVASLWKEKITIEAPKSSLEALAFLLFIVAYKLQKVITKEETALLASFIAQYEQAPTILNSLGLKLEMIPEIVLGLIDKHQYISAVRLICVFKLKNDFSPSLLLKEEIKNLKRSALEMRSSQAEDEDARRLRAILELVANYNLQIKPPRDIIRLFAKLMVQRENSTTCSSNPQAADSQLSNFALSSSRCALRRFDLSGLIYSLRPHFQAYWIYLCDEGCLHCSQISQFSSLKWDYDYFVSLTVLCFGDLVE
ncbi:unnamed protein product [Microthlaspi erraticum]|uniref:FRIGIDA-like protein n=1 Tax=Microthlaspi erraticum TaxID=1685480 RepID=A0A6D2JJG8_9BRAS|nr:unnamed protein product [Microthlaspi erraticum]